ncbi:unnamed protein product [Pleuronectes platessa]|uniref:Uncharacterized protein n=1 Tax=Pleuronectes platessa TaxID=8262 RepID=A0A9N7TGT6_PLEPL|nr:unnamed protein product [Pleuronectes platessa]
MPCLVHSLQQIPDTAADLSSARLSTCCLELTDNCSLRHSVSLPSLPPQNTTAVTQAGPLHHAGVGLKAKLRPPTQITSPETKRVSNPSLSLTLQRKHKAASSRL